MNPPARTLAVAGAIVVHVFVVMSILGQPLDVKKAPASERSLVWTLSNDSVHRNGPGEDVFALYSAGLQLQVARTPYAKIIGNKGDLPYWTRFRYLPILAETVGRAMTHFPPRTIYVGWVLLLELVLVQLCFVFRSSAPAPWLRWAGPCLLLVSSPYWLELHMGQFTFLTAVLFFLALRLCDSPSSDPRETMRAALTYSGAVMLKMVPLVAIPALVRTRRGQICVAAAVTTVLLLTVPLFLVHPGWWVSFQKENLNAELPAGTGGNFGLMSLVFQGLRDSGYTWTPTSWGLAIKAAQLLFIGGAGAAVFFARERAALIGGAALYFAHTASFFDVWEHHSSGVIVVGLGLLWAMEAAPMNHAPAWRWVALVAVIVLVLPTPSRLFDTQLDPEVWDPSTSWPGYARYLVPLAKAVPVLVLYAVAMRSVVARGFVSSG